MIDLEILKLIHEIILSLEKQMLLNNELIKIMDDQKEELKKIKKLSFMVIN